MKYRLYFIVFPDSSHNTDIPISKAIIDLHGRSILEEFILRIASTAGKYRKILPSRLSKTGEYNIIYSKRGLSEHLWLQWSPFKCPAGLVVLDQHVFLFVVLI